MIPAIEWPQTYVLDRAATGTGNELVTLRDVHAVSRVGHQYCTLVVSKSDAFFVL
jgi:hypothetical protein